MHPFLHVVEVAKLALKLGFTAFGGPAAHIAMLRDEVVDRRSWITDDEFLDLLGATNLIPGPNSTEMVIHVSFRRAGWLGLIVGGLCFILPAMASVLGLAWGYVNYGSTPQAEWLLYGVKPVIIAVILQALWNLGKKALKGWLTVLVGMVALVAYLGGSNEILLLFAGGLFVMIVQNFKRRNLSQISSLWFPVINLAKYKIPLENGFSLLAPAPFSPPLLFLTFLKIGSILYGSGYVLLAFLRGDLVQELGWLTDDQLIDAVAIGQLTPGPVFTTATFVGYILDGFSGAILSTIGIFLPSFILVAISTRLLHKFAKSPWFRGLLDGVNATALSLMAAVTLQLGRSAILDPLTAVLGISSGILLFRYKVNTVWLVLGGALIGFIKSQLG